MKFIILSILLTLSALNSAALEIKTGPGQLAMFMKIIGDSHDESVIIVGEADVRDFAVMKNIPSFVKTLDLSDLTVSEFTYTKNGYHGKKYFPADEIPAFSFFGSGLERIILPEKLKTIGEGAFSHSALRIIRTGSSLLGIGDYAFYDCRALTDIELPRSVSSLGKYVFCGASALNGVDLSVTRIESLPQGCFKNCNSLSELSVPENLSYVGREAFANTSLKSLDLRNLTDADEYAFADMTLLEEVILKTGATISTGSFFNCAALEEFTGFPAIVPDAAFCTASKLPLGKDIIKSATFGKYSFYRNESDTVRLPSGITDIESHAFGAMNNLKVIDATRCGSDVPKADNDIVAGLDPSEIILLVAPSTSGIWKDSNVWSRFIILETDGNVTNVKKPVADDIRVYFNRGNVRIVSNSVISRVEIISSAGLRLIDEYPDSEIFTTTLDIKEKFIILRVSAGDSTRILKLDAV